MKLSQATRWGVDIGNVLIENGSYSSYQEVSRMRFIPDSIQGLSFLVAKVGADNVHIISKATIEQSKLSELILRDVICPQTGLLIKNVDFCLERLDKEPIIKRLNLQGHIDDRGQIINSVQDFLMCPVWFNPVWYDQIDWQDKMNAKVSRVNTWQQIMKMW